MAWRPSMKYAYCIVVKCKGVKYISEKTSPTISVYYIPLLWGLEPTSFIDLDKLH